MHWCFSYMYHVFVLFMTYSRRTPFLLDDSLEWDQFHSLWTHWTHHWSHCDSTALKLVCMTQILKRAYFLRNLWFLSVRGHIRKCQSGELRFERLLHDGETESTLLRSRDLALHQLLTLILIVRLSILIWLFLLVPSSLPTLLPPRETGILFPSHQTEQRTLSLFVLLPSLHLHSSHHSSDPSLVWIRTSQAAVILPSLHYLITTDPPY